MYMLSLELESLWLVRTHQIPLLTHVGLGKEYVYIKIIPEIYSIRATGSVCSDAMRSR